MPVCPRCQRLISGSHHERHVARCRAALEGWPRSAAQGDDEGRYGAPGSEVGGRDWKKVLIAAFVIFLLVGSLVVFFVLYAISLL